MRIDNVDERHFYEIGAVQNHWGVEELELEGRLLDHLQEFLLELGKGFAFIGRVAGKYFVRKY